LVLITAGLAAPATSDTTPPELHSMTLSRATVAVSRLETKLLVVSAHLTDDTGVREQPFWPGQEFSPLVRIHSRFVALTLTSGTAQDGIWSGGLAVTSDWPSGAYQPLQVVARDTAGNELSVDPSTVIDPPSIRVASSNKPVLTLTFSPQPAVVGGNLTRTVRLAEGDTGQPMEGVPVGLGYDSSCAEGDQRTPDGRTNSSGVYVTTWTNVTADGLNCAWIVTDNVPEQPATRLAPVYNAATYRWSVTARPASPSAPAGTNVTVTGTLAPSGYNLELQLQRRYPDNTWRTVNRAQSEGEEFTLVATPPSVATHSYRVLAPGRENRVGATSPVFTIRGT
jgi:hypothetical protein